MESIADFLARTARERQDRDAAAARIVINTTEGKPDEVAGDLSLANDWAKTTGKPVPPLPLVTEYRSMFQTQIEDKRNSTILAGAPKLAEWLKNPQNAVLSKDSLDELSWWETTLQATGGAVKRGMMRLPQAYNQWLAFGAAERAADDKRTIGEIYRDETTVRDAQGNVLTEKLLPGPDDLFNTGMRYLTSRMTDLIGSDDQAAAVEYQQRVGEIGKRVAAIPMSEGAAAARDRVGAFKPTGSLTGDLKQFADIVTADPIGFTSFLGQVALESLPSIAAATGVAIATRNPNAAAVTMGTISGATEYGTSPLELLRERGIDVSTPEGALAAISDENLMREAESRGQIRGLIIGALDGLSGGIAGQTLAKSPLGNMALQTIVQGLFGATGEATAQIAAGQEFNLAEVLIEGLAELVTAPIEVGGIASSRMRDAISKSRTAAQTQAQITDIANQALQSKLRTRMPDVFRAWVERATEGGPAENLYVPADKFVGYFQGAGIDPFALADEMDGVTRDDLETALATGGDLRIPTATYAAKLAGSEADQFFMENMRFDPDEFTSAEARAFEETKADLMAEAMAEAERTFQERQDMRSFEEEIYDTMVERLRIAGRATDVATTEAMLYPAFYRVMAERSGLTTQEFLRRYPLPQVRGDMPQGIQNRNIDDLTRTLATARAARQAGVSQPRTPLLDWIAARGGIDDVGGELSARNAAEIKRGRGRRTLRLARGLTEDGKPTLTAEEAASGKRFGWDDVAQAAVEAGFLANNPRVIEWQNAQRDGTVAPDLIPALMEAIDAELRGDAQLTIDEMTAGPSDQDMLDDLERYLGEIGASLDDDDATIRAAIERDQATRGRAYGQFAGPQSETADIHALARAKDMIAKGVSAEQVRRETGWFRGPDMKWRYEISDEDARLGTAGIVTPEEVAAEIGDEIKVGPDAKDPGLFKATWGEGKDYTGAFGRSEQDAIDSLLRAIAKKRTPADAFNPDKIKSGTEYALADILDHDRLYAAYPDLKMIPVRFDNDLKSWGQVNGYGSEMILNADRINAEGGENALLLTILHEVQHLIQRREGFARGGNTEMSGQVRSALQKLVQMKEGEVARFENENRALMMDADEARRMVGYANMYQDFERLIGYARMDRPSGVFRHIRNSVQWFYTPIIQENADLRLRANELQRSLYALPRSGSKRNAFLRQFSFDVAQLLREAVPPSRWEMLTNDPRKTTSMLRALEREAEKASARLKPHYELKKDARVAKGQVENVKYKSPFEIYQLLAGEVEARNTENRAFLTDAQRRDMSPDATMTVDDSPGKKRQIATEDVIVVMQTGEIDTPFIANMEPTEGRSVPGSSLNGLLGSARERIARRNEIADRIAEAGRPVAMTNGDLRVLVGPNTVAGEKPFRVTYMGADGKPNGHVEAATLRDAAVRAMEDGFAPVGAEYGQPALTGTVEVDGIELPLNPDGTVTLYHGTTAAAADQIMQTGLLRSVAEPSVYLTTAMTPDTGYGDGTVVAIDVRPDLLRLDDEFPDGRADFAIDRRAVRIVRSRIVAGGTGKTYNQPAYHGSPHLFEKFSLEKIGTGEGAQAFGWGLYFAGRKSVAAWYRKKLSAGRKGYLTRAGDPTTNFDGIALGEMIASDIGSAYEALAKRFGSEEDVNDGITDVVSRLRYGEAFTGSGTSIEIAIEDALLKAGWDRTPAAMFDGKKAVDARSLADLYAQKIAAAIPSDEFDPDNQRTAMSFAWYASITLAEGLVDKQLTVSDALGAARTDVMIYMRPDGERQTAAVERMFEVLNKTANETEMLGSGRLFEVDIPEDSELLDYDAPLSLQPEGVKEIIRSLPYAPDESVWSETTGADFYEQVRVEMMGDDAFLQVGEVRRARRAEAGRMASEALRTAGIPGHRYLDGGSRSDGDGTRNYVIYDDSRVQVTRFEQENRGSIAFPSAGVGNGETVVNLFRRADLSTFIHESGHYFLTVMQDLAAKGEPAALQEFEAVKSWWRSNADAVAKDAMRVMPDVKVTAADVIRAIDASTTGDIMLDAAIDVGMQEQFARGFEQYLMEGKAPSVELRTAFEKFRAWLVSIYRRLTRLNVEISDEMRGVFDRMLATDDEIAKAQASSGDEGAVFKSAADAGMSPEDWDRYQKIVGEARDEAAAKVLAEAMAPVRRAAEAEYKAERDKVRVEVERKLRLQPVYRATQELRFGRTFEGDETPVKLSRDAIERDYGAGYLRFLPGVTKDGKGHRTAVFTSMSGGMHPDIVAGMYGYTSGRDLLDALTNAQPIAEAIAAETDRIMFERYGDPLRDGSIEATALEAVHGDKRARVLALELSALNKRGGNGTPSRPQQFRAIARRTLSAMKVSDASASARFLTAERKAGTEAYRAVANGDIAAAADAKRRQLLNHMLYAESRKIAVEVEQILDKAAKLGRSDKKLSASIDIDHAKAARAIAAKFGMVRPDPAFDFAMWVEQMRADDPVGADAITGAIATYTQDARDYRKLTVGEIGAVSDAIDSVLAAGKRLKTLEVEGKKIDRQAAMAELMTVIEARKPSENAALSRRLTKFEKAKVGALSVLSSLRRMEAWARDMDDGDQGPFTRYLVRPVMDALDAYRADRTARLDSLLGIINARKEALFGKAIAAPELGYTFENKGELIHAILHTGNESNLEKLLIGRGWSSGLVGQTQAVSPTGKLRTDRQGNPIMTRGRVDTARWDTFVARLISEGVLTKEDYDTAQAIWDLMESTKRPAQAAHKKVFGYYFNEIEASPVVTPFGTYRGGYVPAVADGDASNDGQIRADQAAMEAQATSFMFPTTGSGFAKSRVQNYRTPLALDLMMIPAHMDKVLRFTHLDPVVRQTGSLVNDRELRAAIDGMDKTILPNLVVPWLQRVAQQAVEAQPTTPAGRQAARVWRGLRRRVGLHTMFMNVVNTAQQVTGFSTAMVLVKPGLVKSALIRFVKGDAATMRAEAFQASQFMNDRIRNASRETQVRIQDAITQPTVMGDMKLWLERHGYVMQTAFQNVVDVIVWHAAYDQAIGKGMAEADAVFEADSVIRRSMSAMDPESVSLFESGSAFTRLFTMFYSYFNGQANLVGGEMRTVMRTMGWNGAGKMFWIYVFGIAVPAIVAEMIVQGARGELGDEDDDGYADDLFGLFFGSQARYLAAMIPVAGQLGTAVFNRFNDQFYDDRLSTSPVVSVVERAIGAPASIGSAAFGDGDASRAVGDGLTALGLILGLPAGWLVKAGGYAVDVAEGDAKPAGPVDLVQGVVTGRDGTAQ